MNEYDVYKSTQYDLESLHNRHVELQGKYNVAWSELNTCRETVVSLSRKLGKTATEADTLRRQRDELLQALRLLTSHKDSKLSTDVEYIGIHQRAQRILAQYEDNAVTGVTQGDSK